MTTSSLQISRTYLAAASIFASTDETRFHLCGVWLTSDKGKLVVMATDGRRMLILRTDKERIEDDIFIPNALLAAALATTPEGHTKNIFVQSEEGKTTVDAASLIISQQTTRFSVEWKKAVPAIFPDKCEFTWVHMRYLSDFWTAAKMLGMDGFVKMGAESKTTPLVAWTPKSKTPQLTLIIQQMRLGHETQT